MEKAEALATKLAPRWEEFEPAISAGSTGWVLFGTRPAVFESRFTDPSTGRSRGQRLLSRHVHRMQRWDQRQSSSLQTVTPPRDEDSDCGKSE